MKYFTPVLLVFFWACELPVEQVYIETTDTIYIEISSGSGPVPSIKVNVLQISSYTGSDGLGYVDVRGLVWNEGAADVWSTRISLSTNEGYVYVVRPVPAYVAVDSISHWEASGLRGRSVRTPVVSFVWENGQYP